MSDPLRWTAHPARRRPALAVAVVAFVAAVAVVGSHALGPGLQWTAMLFAALLLASVSTFLLPTRYEIDEEAITLRHLLGRRRRLLREIRRVEVEGRYALLSPFTSARALDRFRALVLPLDGVPTAVRARLEAMADELGERALSHERQDHERQDQG